MAVAPKFNAIEKMRLVDAIALCEVGLRDGLQSEKVMLSVEEKVDVVNSLVDAGFKTIEVGSFVSPRAVPQMANTDEVFQSIVQVPGIEYRALVANVKGVERAAACGCRKVKLNVSASTAHNLANLNKTPEQSVAEFAACVERAKECEIEVSGSISMAFGSPWDKEIPVSAVMRIAQAYLAVGIDEISLSDASGMAYPTQVYTLCRTMQQHFPQATWWLHFHNTRGLGLANMLAGMHAGFTRFDSAFAGVGGCPFVPGAAGNISTEDALHMCDEMGVNTGVDLDKVLAVSRRIVAAVGHATDSYLLRAGKSKDLILELPKGQIKNQTQK